MTNPEQAILNLMVLTACCGSCGKTISRPCPQLAQAPEIADSFEAEGWVFTVRGVFCSAECARGDAA